ncbi:MAG: PEGA domain-containing protein [Kofleriaceae bacterium]
MFSKPSANVSIDGKDTGLSTPLSGRRRLRLKTGRRRITLTTGGESYDFTVTIEDGETTTLSRTLGD